MKSLISTNSRGIPIGTRMEACDNSGARMIKVFNVIGVNATRKRRVAAGVGDLVMASVISGKPDMRRKVVFAVIVRQKKEYKRVNGLRITFEDNAAIVLKDDKGNPKGTLIKGPIAKEVVIRWPAVAKIASIVV